MKEGKEEEMAIQQVRPLPKAPGLKRCAVAEGVSGCLRILVWAIRQLVDERTAGL